MAPLAFVEIEKSIFSNFTNVKSSKIIFLISHFSFFISHFLTKRCRMHSLVRGIPLHEPALLVLVGHVEITGFLVEGAHLLHLFVEWLIYMLRKEGGRVIKIQFPQSPNQ